MRSTLNFNSHWQFTKPGAAPVAVTLPHTWNTDTGAGGHFLETTANYQNDMYIPAEWASKRLFVKFYGVQNVADLFVNGYHVGAHRGGSSAFTFDITD